MLNRVDFVGSKTYGPSLHYDVNHSGVARDWVAAFPADRWPALAFTGAPASYPVQKENVRLHRHLFNWVPEMEARAKEFIHAQRGAFVALHLRNGADWSRACALVEGSPLLFAAAQCVGYHREHGSATKVQELCYYRQDLDFRRQHATRFVMQRRHGYYLAGT